MIAEVGFFVLGLAALLLGAELLVRGASQVAATLGLSPLVIGLTIVAFGTSAPELAISVGAALHGANDIAVGNVVGSNIFNVLLILGVSALITPLVVNTQLIRQEVPIMLGASLLLLVMVLNGHLSRIDCAVLLGLLAAYVVFLVRQSRAQNSEASNEHYAQAVEGRYHWSRHWAVQLTLIVGGLALLVAGSNWLVDSSVAFARAFGVSDLVIGLTIIAAGTSMPELATSIVAAIRGERDIAIGNVVGSNTFNILGCLGAAGLVSADGLPIAAPLMSFDIWVMAAVALSCLPVFIAGREIGRAKGLMFVGYYAAYLTYLILDAHGHDALPQFSAIMLGFVLPLTIVTLIAMLVRHQNNAAAPE
jgi:cation:H+ antiporter